MRSLAPWVALAFAGCSVGRDYAESRRVLVEPGMAAAEVVKRVGEPTARLKVATASTSPDQTTEIWTYEIDGPPGPEDFVFLVLATGALVLVVASKGGGGGGIHGGSFQHFRFRVGFGPDGRVRGVTNLEGVK